MRSRGIEEWLVSSFCRYNLIHINAMSWNERHTSPVYLNFPLRFSALLLFTLLIASVHFATCLKMLTLAAKPLSLPLEWMDGEGGFHIWRPQDFAICWPLSPPCPQNLYFVPQSRGITRPPLPLLFGRHIWKPPNGDAWLLKMAWQKPAGWGGRILNLLKCGLGLLL